MWKELFSSGYNSAGAGRITLGVHGIETDTYFENTVPIQEATFLLAAAYWPLTSRQARREIATLGDGRHWASSSVLRILISVARSIRNACWHRGDLWRGLTRPA
jgi:hypothetical protein